MSKVWLSNVRENDDNYKWSELNCFYKVFAISLGSFDKKYFDYFLMYISAYLLYRLKGNEQLTLDSGDCVLEYYKQELQPIFGNVISKKDFTGYRAFVKKMRNTLNDGKVIILPCDLYYLPYSKNYLELHKRHYVIVKGMDISKGIVYILDNMHIDFGASTIYKDFVIDIRVLYDMTVSFRYIFENFSNNYFFWSIDNQKNEQFENYNYTYFLKLKEFIWDNCEYMEIDDIKIDMEHYLEYANLRVVFFNSLINLAKNNEQKKMLNEALTEWNKVKYEIGIRDLATVKEKVLKNIELEKNCIRQLDIVEENKLEDFAESDYKVINRQNAKIVIENNFIDVCLDSDDVYDIWGNIDNGVFILKDRITNQCRANITIDTELGSSSNCGIYIEFQDGKRILYGSLGRLNMAIHAIDDIENYELCKYQEIIEKKMQIGITYDDKNCYFYSGVDNSCKYVMKLNASIYRVGFYVKTWERCECKVHIEDILVKSN